MVWSITSVLLNNPLNLSNTSKTHGITTKVNNVEVVNPPITANAIGEGKEALFDQLPVGTGPYIYKSFLRDNLIRYHRNPEYWKQNIPIKQTKIEEEIIKYFEKKGEFKSNF